MAKRVLIVDDESTIQQMLTDFFTDEGYDVACASDGEEAIRQFNVDPPDIAIIDFLLPRKNGFDVARSVRSNPLVADRPLIMMSGVFKNPKTAVEAREKYGALAFLDKPLDLGTLASLVRDALAASTNRNRTSAQDNFELALSLDDDDPLGLDFDAGAKMPAASDSSLALVDSRPFRAMPAKGGFAEFPSALLLSIIRYDSLTGILDMSDVSVHRRVYTVAGTPIFMQSNAEGENVGTLLYNRGRINKPDYDRCLDYMDSQKRTMQRSLLELRLTTEQELATAYKLLAQQLLPAAMGMSLGTFSWRETDAFIGRVPEGKFEPAVVLFSGIRDFVLPPQIMSFFEGREDVPLMKTQEFAALLPFYRRVFSGSQMTSRIDGQSTYRDLTRSSGADIANVSSELYALVTSGMLILPEVTEGNLMDVAVNQAASEIAGLADGGLHMGSQSDEEPDEKLEDAISFTEQENTARSQIQKGYEQIMSQTFYRIFELTHNDDLEPDDLRETYYKLTKKWHSDAFAGLRLGPEEELQKEIFHRISIAYETLTDDVRRGEYLVYLDRKKRGLPTDVETVMEAEKTFDEALNAIKRRDYDTANALVDRAIAMNGGEAIYVAYSGWLKYRIDKTSPPSIQIAISTLKRAIEMQQNLPIAYRFLGEVYEANSQMSFAKENYKRCLQYQPNNIEAARAVRLINTRAQKSKKGGGLISKLLSKK